MVPNIHIIPAKFEFRMPDRSIENFVCDLSAECEKTNPPTAAELEAYAAVYGDDALCDQDLNQACVRVSD